MRPCELRRHLGYGIPWHKSRPSSSRCWFLDSSMLVLLHWFSCCRCSSSHGRENVCAGSLQFVIFSAPALSNIQCFNLVKSLIKFEQNIKSSFIVSTPRRFGGLFQAHPWPSRCQVNMLLTSYEIFVHARTQASAMSRTTACRNLYGVQSNRLALIILLQTSSVAWSSSQVHMTQSVS